jgi:hypothetical protein
MRNRNAGDGGPIPPSPHRGAPARTPQPAPDRLEHVLVAKVSKERLVRTPEPLRNITRKSPRTPTRRSLRFPVSFPWFIRSTWGQILWRTSSLKYSSANLSMLTGIAVVRVTGRLPIPGGLKDRQRSVEEAVGSAIIPLLLAHATTSVSGSAGFFDAPHNIHNVRNILWCPLRSLWGA